VGSEHAIRMAEHSTSAGTDERMGYLMGRRYVWSGADQRVTRIHPSR
jgi:hypothetical protein